MTSGSTGWGRTLIAYWICFHCSRMLRRMRASSASQPLGGLTLFSARLFRVTACLGAGWLAASLAYAAGRTAVHERQLWQCMLICGILLRTPF